MDLISIKSYFLKLGFYEWSYEYWTSTYLYLFGDLSKDKYFYFHSVCPDHLILSLRHENGHASRTHFNVAECLRHHFYWLNTNSSQSMGPTCNIWTNASGMKLSVELHGATFTDGFLVFLEQILSTLRKIKGKRLFSLDFNKIEIAF